MDRDAALNILRDAAPQLRECYGVVGARLFGSLARGDHDDQSDVDVAVRLESAQFDALKVCGVSGLLSGLFGADVDVVVEPAKDPGLTLVIERDAVVAF